MMGRLEKGMPIRFLEVMNEYTCTIVPINHLDKESVSLLLGDKTISPS